VCFHEYTSNYTRKSGSEYEYVNEKAMKEWWSTYEDGDLLRNLEYWPERYIKGYETHNICNDRAQCI